MVHKRITKKNIFIYWVVLSIAGTFLAAAATTFLYWVVLNFFEHGVFFTNYRQLTFTVDFYLRASLLWGGCIIAMNIIRIITNMKIVKKHSVFFSWVLIFICFGFVGYLYYITEIAGK